MALKRIPNNVESLIRASVFVNNYKKAIEELVYNSLDAESTSIAIRVFIDESSIQILDNGNGINKIDFQLLGHRYMSSNIVTSFISSRQKFGYRGLSLASIIEISQEVKITSRSNSSEDTYVKTFVNSKEQDICKTNTRPSMGTTVEIKGFLYNLHIKKKLINPLLEMEHIKMFLECLSLVSFSVSISLRDESKNEIIFKIHKNRDIYQTLLSLFNIKKKDIQELHVEKNQYKILGFIEKSNIVNIKTYHWIYINGRVITQCKVNKIVNKHFNGSWNQKMITKTIKDNLKDTNDIINKKIPSYFLFITCPNYDYDIIYAPEKTFVEFKKWSEIEMLIEKLLKFYHGELKVNLISKREICNHMTLNESGKDTRQQVKCIMEKILGNNLKKPKVSQIPNGIKGNHIKRKKKKKIQEFKKPYIELKNGTNGVSCIEGLLEYCSNGLETHEHVQSKNNSTQNHSKISREIKKLPSYNMERKCLLKKQNTKKDKIENITYSHDIVIRKLKQPSTTVKKRCAVLFDNDQMLLKKNKPKVRLIKEQDKVVLNSVAYQNVKQTKHSIVTKNFNSNHQCIFIEAKENTVSRDKEIVFKTTYDLIKPIHKSQQQLRTTTQLSTLTNAYTLPSDSNLTKFTYESHKYKTRFISKRQATRQFITTPSCNNFFLHKDNNLFFSNNKRLQRRKESRNKFSINFKRYVNQCVETTRNTNFTVDQSSTSQKTDPKYGFHHMNEILPVSANNTMPAFNSTHSKYNFNIERTYDIENLISLPNTVINYTEYDLQKTYTIQLSNNIKHRTETRNVHLFPELTVNSLNASNNINIGLVADSENSGISVSDFVYPLNVCETIYNSYQLQSFEKEFEFSFGSKNKNNTDDGCFKKLSNELEDAKGVSQCFAKEIADNDLTSSDHNRKRNNIINSEVCDKEIDNMGTVNKFSKKYTENNKVNSDKETENFELKSRNHFVPKGMSPIMLNVLTECDNTNHGEEYYEDQIYRDFAKDIQIYTEIFEARVQNINDFTTREIEKVTCKINKANKDWIFDAESLKYAKVLGQVDSKFIASKVFGKSAKHNKSCEFLVLFDQHAVDERIRLENNLKDYKDGHNWKNVTLDPIVLKFSKDNILYLHNYKDKFARFGLQWTLEDGNISINSIPKAILGQNPRHVDIIIMAVKCLISEQIEAIKSLKGNVSLYPKSIMDLVFSEACRYAIKFGDELTRNECQNMLSSLSKCKVPFQCAHGRPVMAVMMEVPKTNHNYKVSRSAIIKFQRLVKQNYVT